MIFDDYIRSEEPGKEERAQAWKVAIGLQDVDGLKTSAYLRETAARHIEGDITIDEVRELINSYYLTKSHHGKEDNGEEEADKVSSNIAKILSEQSFTFSSEGLASIHRHIFNGVFTHAGRFRQYDITKKEWVLRGDTVLYGRWQDLRATLDYDIVQERNFNYTGLNLNQIVEHIAQFISGLWQIHPFEEGNTRATAVFYIKYLRSAGFNVSNNLFYEHSWYFRNALVRANYRDIQSGIDYDISFLVRFLRNLMLGEGNDLSNRSMLINPPLDWKSRTPASTPASSVDILLTNNDSIHRLVRGIGDKQLSVKEILLALGLKDRMSLQEYHLSPAIREGFVTMLYPDKPRHPRQKYLLTIKGRTLLAQLRMVMSSLT